MMGPQARSTWRPQGWKGQGGPSPGALRGSTPRPLPAPAWERTGFCLFKPLQGLRAALGGQRAGDTVHYAHRAGEETGSEGGLTGVRDSIGTES